MIFTRVINFTMSLKVNEIYYSIQGESTHAGKPCIFIRLTYCNLRCTYCDTEYAFYDGKDMEIHEIIKEIAKWNCQLVEITGGEPLMQDMCIDLLQELVTKKYNIMLETSGSLSIAKVPREVIKIIDFKCPSSKMDKKNLWTIIKYIQPYDEIKFVIGNREDFDWAKGKIIEYQLDSICTILFSPTYGKINPQKIVKWILEENLPVRMQLQLHKVIWQPEQIGV